MANKFLKGEYTPENPKKYGGRGKIIYRSGWELRVMQQFDRHPDVIWWASEPFSLPYYNPITKQNTVYIPDFMVVYADRRGKQHCEMIEVKPAKEVMGYQTASTRSGRKLAMVQAINEAKWQMARAYCAKRGIFFRVITENEIFQWGNKK